MGRVFLFKLFILLALSSCGPVYRSTFDYTPPLSSEGQQCILECGNSRQHCQELEQVRAENCYLRREIRYRNCLFLRRFQRFGYCRFNCFCSPPYCPRPNFERCEREYNECYENCGGAVAEERICVRNCEDEKAA